MTRIVQAFVVTAAIVAGAAQTLASPLITLSNLQIGGELDLETPENATTEAPSTTPASLGEAPGRPDALTGPAGGALALSGVEASGIAYPVTGAISFGIAYQLQDAEDLAETLIDDGLAQESHLNHSLVVQTIWRFGDVD